MNASLFRIPPSSRLYSKSKTPHRHSASGSALRNSSYVLPFSPFFSTIISVRELLIVKMRNLGLEARPSLSSS